MRVRRYTAAVINEVCLTQGKVSKDRLEVFEDVVKELPYWESAVIRHFAGCGSAQRCANILDVPLSYYRRQYKKAIRHLRAPLRYYRLLLGDRKYNDWLENPKGTIPVNTCGFTTKTTNTLIRNGFTYMEQFKEYIGNVPERFAYIDGLGKIGMSEILYYYIE